MQATINPKDGFKQSHRKENNFKRQISGFTIEDGRLKEVVCLRIYETNSRVYACVWISGIGASGSGYAGGCGYHMGSAAAAAALNDAGITFDEGISALGYEAVEEAVKAIGEALGFQLFVHTAHP